MELNRFLTEEDGVGVVEVILILVVLISLVLIFQRRITEVANDILDRIEGGATRVRVSQ